jgi:hypothetical protein
MTDVSKILRGESTDPTLQLLALDPWILHFQPSDYPLLQNVDIFHTIHKLMLSAAPSQRRRGSPAGMHRYKTTADFDLIKHEKSVKEKLNKASKALFRLLGVNCIRGSDEEEENEMGKILYIFVYLVSRQRSSANFLLFNGNSIRDFSQR